MEGGRKQKENPYGLSFWTRHWLNCKDRTPKKTKKKNKTRRRKRRRRRKTKKNKKKTKKKKILALLPLRFCSFVPHDTEISKEIWQSVAEFPGLYEIPLFIMVCPKRRHLTVSWSKWIKSTTYLLNSFEC
jgi:hypothetical protein